MWPCFFYGPRYSDLSLAESCQAANAAIQAGWVSPSCLPILCWCYCTNTTGSSLLQWLYLQGSLTLFTAVTSIGKEDQLMFFVSINLSWYFYWQLHRKFSRKHEFYFYAFSSMFTVVELRNLFWLIRKKNKWVSVKNCAKIFGHLKACLEDFTAQFFINWFHKA